MCLELVSMSELNIFLCNNCAFHYKKMSNLLTVELRKNIASVTKVKMIKYGLAMGEG